MRLVGFGESLADDRKQKRDRVNLRRPAVSLKLLIICPPLEAVYRAPLKRAILVLVEDGLLFKMTPLC